MRKTLLATCAVAGIGLLAGSTVEAQAPAGGQSAGATNRSARSGAATKRRPQGNAGPSRISPSLGSSVSGGIGLSGGGASGKARRQPKRNSTPVLSPYLNLDAGFANSFESRLLTNVLPQQEFSRTQRQTQRAFDTVQGEIGQQQLEIQTGLSTTGHKTAFMSLGQYYPRPQ
jgi:hypothetical protein